MLKLMRDRFKSLKVVLWFVVFVFVAYFVADFGGLIFQNPDEQPYAARLGDIRIPEGDFQREYRQTLDRYREMYQQGWKPEMAAQLNLPQQTLDGLIYRHVLLAEARENGLDATDDEVRERLRQSFSRDGEFVGRDAYERYVRSLGLTPPRFEQLLRQDIILGKLNGLLEQSMLVTDAQIEEEFSRQKDRAKIAYVKQGLEPFLAVQFDEAVLKTFYESSREKYRAPEKRKIKYLLVENFKLAQELKATDEELLAYYEAHREEYSSPEQVTASHILLKVPEGASPAGELEVQQHAREIYELAVAPGADFAALARTHTEEPGGKERAGDLGTFQRGRMVPEFEEAAFSLPAGGVSEPVKTQFGYHVIKVVAKLPAGVQPFEAVKPRLNAAVVQPRLKQAARERAETLARQILEKKLTTDEQLRALATGAVTFNETPFFAKSEPVPGFGRAPELGKAVFELAQGRTTTVVDTPRGPVIARVAEVRAAGIPSFEDLREQLAADYRRDTAGKAARTKLDGVAAAVRAGATLEKAAADAGLTVATSEEFGRGGSVPELGASRELEEAVFAAETGAVGGPVAIADGALVLFRVVEKKSFDKAELDKERAGLRERLRNEELGRFLQSIVNRAKSREALYINEELMKRFAAGT